MGIISPKDFIRQRRWTRLSSEELVAKRREAVRNIEEAEVARSEDSWRNHRLACQIQASLQDIADIETCAHKRGLSLSEGETDISNRPPVAS